MAKITSCLLFFIFLLFLLISSCSQSKVPTCFVLLFSLQQVMPSKNRILLLLPAHVHRIQVLSARPDPVITVVGLKSNNCPNKAIVKTF